MRQAILFVLFLYCGMLNAQNWALLNPAYKYNYSNDGTDTISNQIFVTHVDTLGPDSFRYELNKVAVPCDTCEASNMTVSLRLDEPQFLGGQVTRSQNIWHLQNGVSYLLLPAAVEGSTWLMDTLNSVWATMGATSIGTQFDGMEERRKIQLSTGDSIVVGRDHGILHWSSGYDLIGINGPDIGITIPSFVDFFPYAAGDVVQYATGNGGWDGSGGGYGYERDYKFTAGSTGDVQDSAIVFPGWIIGFADNYFQNDTWSPVIHSVNYSNGATTWNAGVPELPWPELLFSYPGQLVRTTHRVSPYDTSPMLCIAEHGIDDAGRYTIGCRDLGGGYFVSDQEPIAVTNGYSVFYGPGDYCSGDPQQDCGVRYTAGLGLEWFIGNYDESGEAYVLSGAVLGGDTIGTISPDSVLVTMGIPEQMEVGAITLHPVPANDQIVLTKPEGLTGTWSITNLAGQQLASGQLEPSAAQTIDVSRLAAGSYLFTLNSKDGRSTRRLILAR